MITPAELRKTLEAEASTQVTRLLIAVETFIGAEWEPGKELKFYWHDRVDRLLPGVFAHIKAESSAAGWNIWQSTDGEGVDIFWIKESNT